jgi:TIR domain
MSYRREDAAYPAGWLFDLLASHFGEDKLFKDVDSIHPGDDFVEVITAAVGSCDVLLVLIGSQWLTITDQNGQRRLDNPDFVRLEIETALTRDVRVIPILVGEAKMPRATSCQRAWPSWYVGRHLSLARTASIPMPSACSGCWTLPSRRPPKRGYDSSSRQPAWHRPGSPQPWGPAWTPARVGTPGDPQTQR